MARSRAFLRVRPLPDGTLRHVEKGGPEIPGPSFHKTNESYYSIDEETGNRVFYGREVTMAVDDFRNDCEHQEAYWEHLDKGVEVATVIQDLSGPQLNRVLAAVAEPFPKHSKERLSDCLAVWIEWMTADKPFGQNVRDVRGMFDRFKEYVGNLPISALKYDHFHKWQLWIKRKSKSWKSVKTPKDHQAVVERGLKFAKRKRRDWMFPQGLLEGADHWTCVGICSGCSTVMMMQSA